MKDDIVYSGNDEKAAIKYYEKYVLPADQDALPPKKVTFTNRSGKTVTKWQITATKIIGFRPVIIDKKKR